MLPVPHSIQDYLFTEAQARKAEARERFLRLTLVVVLIYPAINFYFMVLDVGLQCYRLLHGM